MAEHEHQIVTHLYHVKVPYHMDPKELNFELESEGSNQILPDLLADLAEYKDDEIRRVLTGAVLLLERFPHRGLEEALNTAMVWERG